MKSGRAEEGKQRAATSPRPKIRLSPVGFWSYSRRDDELSRGRLSQLRALLLAELQAQYGRDGIQLFQDVSAIPHGADWDRITTDALNNSTFFIPIITPFFAQSRWCARETRSFLEREQRLFETYPDLPRESRIFPLLLIDVEGVEPIDAEAFAMLRGRQWCDFTRLRNRSFEHEAVLDALSAFAASIRDVLQLRVDKPLTDEERTGIVAPDQHLRDSGVARQNGAEEDRTHGEASAVAQRAVEEEKRHAREADQAAARKRSGPGAEQTEQTAAETERSKTAPSLGTVTDTWTPQRVVSNKAVLGTILALLLVGLAVSFIPDWSTPGEAPPPAAHPMASGPAAPPASAALGPVVDAPAPSPATPQSPIADQPRRRAAPSSPTIHLGTFSSRQQALAAWEQLAGRYSGLRQLRHSVRTTEGPRAYYRLRAEGQNAEEVCDILLAAGDSCVTVE